LVFTRKAQEKRDERIKARTVAGGNKQRGFITKEEPTSPTVSTESVILTSVIDALEGRDVAIIDIPNAFIQTKLTDKDEMAIIRIRRMLVDTLLDIAPEVYKPYICEAKQFP
jgi:Reverse transcriptase (RNA-dependent DNA polymerase)